MNSTTVSSLSLVQKDTDWVLQVMSLTSTVHIFTVSRSSHQTQSWTQYAQSLLISQNWRKMVLPCDSKKEKLGLMHGEIVIAIDDIFGDPKFYKAQKG
jgi:anaerobic selenocysteine-containing dehydrogenase